MSTMVISIRSSLNPNAPLFVPMAYQQVEDFSPEWWELVKTTPWFRDYWFHQHQEQESFDYAEEEDVADLLPDSFDIGITDEFSAIDAELEQAGKAEQPLSDATKADKLKNGFSGGDAAALVRNLNMVSQKNGGRPVFEPAKHREKPAKFVSPKCSTRHNIQQPR